MIDAAANDALEALEACPCCLLGKQDRYLNTPYIHQNKTEIYSDMLKECFNMKLDVASDKCGICEECVVRLREATHFKRQVRRSQTELKKRLARAIKIIEEVPPTVKLEVADEDEASDNLLGEDPPAETVDEEGASEDSATASCGCGCGGGYGRGQCAARARLVLQECAVSLERDAGLEALLGGHSRRATADEDQTVARLAHLHSDIHDDLHTTTDDTEQLIYTCDTCNKSFALKTQLEKHIMVMRHIHQNAKQKSKRGASSDILDKRAGCDGHRCDMEDDIRSVTNSTEEETYSCDTCKKSFNLKTQLVKHIMVMNHIHQNSEKKSKRRSSTAPAGARGRRGGRARTRTGSVEDAHEKYRSCGICEKKFMCLSHLKRHEVTHTGIKAYSCELCKKSYTTLGDLKRHKVVHIGIKAHSCGICKMSFTTSYYLKIHERVHTGLKAYSCEICKKSFKNSCKLKRHEVVHTGIKPYSCEICKKSFNNSSNLKRHEEVHTGIKAYSCGICKHSFTRLGSLQIHERIHTGLKAYSCEVCEKSFTTLGNLKQHEVIHTGLKAYSCKICKKSFATLGYLKHHEVIHTGLKAYFCKLCEKSFMTSGNLKQHEVVHTGLKAYSCEICKKNFTTSGYLKQHEVVHTGLKAYSCEICKKNFTTSGYLKHHAVIHKGNY